MCIYSQWHLYFHSCYWRVVHVQLLHNYFSEINQQQAYRDSNMCCMCRSNYVYMWQRNSFQQQVQTASVMNKVLESKDPASSPEKSSTFTLMSVCIGSYLDVNLSLHCLQQAPLIRITEILYEIWLHLHGRMMLGSIQSSWVIMNISNQHGHIDQQISWPRNVPYLVGVLPQFEQQHCKDQDLLDVLLTCTYMNCRDQG